MKQLITSEEEKQKEAARAFDSKNSSQEEILALIGVLALLASKLH